MRLKWKARGTDDWKVSPEKASPYLESSASYRLREKRIQPGPSQATWFSIRTDRVGRDLLGAEVCRVGSDLHHPRCGVRCVRREGAVRRQKLEHKAVGLRKCLH